MAVGCVPKRKKVYLLLTCQSTLTYASSGRGDQLQFHQFRTIERNIFLSLSLSLFLLKIASERSPAMNLSEHFVLSEFFSICEKNHEDLFHK